MEEIITKEELKEIMSLKGEARGIAPKNSAKFIQKEEGEQGLKKLEETMAKIGYPIDYSKIKPMNFYPLKLLALTLLVIKKLFNYDDKKFLEMGYFRGKSSWFIRFFMNRLVSFEKLKKGAPEMWRMFHTAGKVKVIEADKKKRIVIMRIRNYRCHPIHCQVLVGIFSALAQFVLKREGEIVGEETKCIYRGDEYHEFLLKW